MEFLPGHILDYRAELSCAAACLADIHSVKLADPSGLLVPENPLKAILEECEEMVKTYMESPLGDAGKKVKIQLMLDRGWKSLENIENNDTYRCCINTDF